MAEDIDFLWLNIALLSLFNVRLSTPPFVEFNQNHRARTWAYVCSQLLIAVSFPQLQETMNNWSWFLQRSCKTKPLGGAEMKKGGAIYDQIMQTEPSRKMPPPFYGPQQNNLQETIYYQHGFPLVSTKT